MDYSIHYFAIPAISSSIVCRFIARLKLYERQYSAISPSVLNILLSRKKLSPIVRLMVPKGCSDKHFLLSIFFSSIWRLK